MVNINVIFAIMCIISFLCAAVTGNLETLSGSVVEGAEKAVELTFRLCGAMCLWNGVMRVASDSGMIGSLARFFRPVLRFVFPSAYTGAAQNAKANSVSALIAANFLGIGNAATPLAISAMKALDDGSSGSADDMTTLAVLGTASIDLIPTTLLSLRFASGSKRPFSIIVPVWIVSTLCALLAVIVAKLSSAGKKLARGDKISLSAATSKEPRSR